MMTDKYEIARALLQSNPKLGSMAACERIVEFVERALRENSATQADYDTTAAIPGTSDFPRKSAVAEPGAVEEPDAEWLARWFHDTYERLAPEFGYTTREETRQFDPKAPNGKLMIAVVKALTWELQLRLVTTEYIESIVAVRDGLNAEVLRLHADCDLLSRRLRDAEQRGDYWSDLYQREGQSHLETINALAAEREQAAQSAAELERVRKDMERCRQATVWVRAQDVHSFKRDADVQEFVPVDQLPALASREGNPPAQGT
jgi:hypothetical protein